MSACECAPMTATKRSVRVGSFSTAGASADTSWPSEARSAAAPSTAATHSGSTANVPAEAVKPIRSRPGSMPTSAASGPGSAGATKRSPSS